MGVKGEEYLIDLSKAEKVVTYRMGLSALLSNPTIAPMLIIIFEPLIYSVLVAISNPKGGFVEILYNLLLSFVCTSLIIWFITPYRYIPLLYRKDIIFAVFDNAFVSVFSEHFIYIPRKNARIFRGMFNTNVISNGEFNILVNSNAIQYDELKLLAK